MRKFLGCLYTQRSRSKGSPSQCVAMLFAWVVCRLSTFSLVNQIQWYLYTIWKRIQVVTFLASRPKSNYGNSFVPFRQSESWEKNCSSLRTTTSQLTAIGQVTKVHDENQPSFPLFASYHGELLLSIFLATGISWTSFLHLATTFYKSHIFLPPDFFFLLAVDC